MIRVEISEDAQADLNEGFLFYEAQGPGIGDYFIACLRADIEGLKMSGGAHRVVYADYHRLVGSNPCSAQARGDKMASMKDEMQLMFARRVRVN
jgi:hypothetical protein